MCKLVKYVRKCVVFWTNLHSWQKFYTTTGSGGREKFQVCTGAGAREPTCFISRKRMCWFSLGIGCIILSYIMTSIHFVIALCEWCSSKLLQNWVTSFPWKTPNAFHNFQKFCVPTIIVWLAKKRFCIHTNLVMIS